METRPVMSRAYGRILFTLLAPLFLLHDAAHAGDFSALQKEGKRYVAEEKQGFAQYKRELQSDFAQYQRIAREESARYKAAIGKHWTTPEVSDRRKWVEYSPDFKVKRVVDFERSELRIEVLTAKEQKITSARFREILIDLLKEDKQTAFKRDSMAQKVEERLAQQAKHVKSATVAKEPILSPDTRQGQLKTQEVNRTVDQIMKSASIEERPSGIKGTPTLIALKARIPEGIASKKAGRYKPKVDSYAKKQDVSGALVLAVIHTESDFNPMARSNAPAYGLMQIVPQSAGQDATEYLYGRPYVLSPSFLYNDDNNINIGTAYIHILFHNYLKDIRNPESRLYCAIAAYNTGAGNMARAFAGDRNLSRAIGIINRKTPSEVYDTLIKRLPYDETKNYLRNVSGRLKQYQQLYVGKNKAILTNID